MSLELLTEYLLRVCLGVNIRLGVMNNEVMYIHIVIRTHGELL